MRRDWSTPLLSPSPKPGDNVDTGSTCVRELDELSENCMQEFLSTATAWRNSRLSQEWPLSTTGLPPPPKNKCILQDHRTSDCTVGKW